MIRVLLLSGENITHTSYPSSGTIGVIRLNEDGNAVFLPNTLSQYPPGCDRGDFGGYSVDGLVFHELS